MKKLFLVLMLVSGTALGKETNVKAISLPFPDDSVKYHSISLKLDENGNPIGWEEPNLEDRIKSLEARVTKLEEKRGIVVDTDEHYYSGVSSDGVHYMKIK